jgi:hypothetical protein
MTDMVCKCSSIWQLPLTRPGIWLESSKAQEMWQTMTHLKCNQNNERMKPVWGARKLQDVETWGVKSLRKKWLEEEEQEQERGELCSVGTVQLWRRNKC